VSPATPDRRLDVVVFSGGRGSLALTSQLAADPRVRLTVAINGYDDGASTGAVRRLLGDCLGPSDFRKNASRIAATRGTADPDLIRLLDTRLPEGITPDAAIDALRRQAAGRADVADRVEAFVGAHQSAGRPFDFGDCSVGNLVFAGSFLRTGRRFNEAVDDYCALVGLPAGDIDNVTDGANAWLVAIGAEGVVFASEETIVGAAGANRIRDIYLIDRPLSAEEGARLTAAGPVEAAAWFARHEARVGLNPRVAARLASADLIVYAPGTQHSSLFPSYLTPGLTAAIAGNLGAIKLLITNIQTDAEIAGSTAVDLIDRALYYMNGKGRGATPTPCLITHYVVNDPGHVEASTPYVPLGRIETLEDPRLVRIANYEDGISGRHDAARILGPFIASLADAPRRQRVAVFLHDAGSINKVTQTLVEMVRGGVTGVPVDVTAFYEGEPLDGAFLESLPFGVERLDAARTPAAVAATGAFDYVILFESSGMYRGEDIVALAEQLPGGRLDAVWGSRRLSVRDIQESLRFRYQKTPLFRAISAAGSHVLSLACLFLYGRYISDTLSAVRAVRADDVAALNVPVSHKRANQHLLARLLRRRAEIVEVPVQFFPISPERVKRTSVLEGLQSIGALVAGRIRADRSADVQVRHVDHPAEAGSHNKRTTPVGSR
jgi:2-phospho-L-lactate transferase/gluconeogenesis factor (CofD/UPF0052 family)